MSFGDLSRKDGIAECNVAHLDWSTAENEKSLRRSHYSSLPAAGKICKLESQNLRKDYSASEKST